ncbi:hypothetical protein BDN70DRAFT_876312 [Pholiota conissans]|uniref:Mediator of RNA polymerase II transcription subunit 5 n=1 Tax=Pholiota conissans TaxID=109636 RepID=A0A9P6D2E9_9AGAR|nr:hypothetical protein BDN70DRAFT_876312 [Pholiota conissans]
MYLAELTRNAFQSGISAPKWLALSKLMIEKTPIQLEGHGEVASNLSNSVLVLYRSYPGDPGLQDYLKAAIQDGILPVSTFVSTLLQAARSSELHIPATLDTLCRIALDAHYASGQPPMGSVVPFSESPSVVLQTIQDALALLRTAYSLPMSHFHQLTTSVAELVMLLVSCVPDPSQVSTAQALVHYSDVDNLLTNCRLSPDLRQVLETFALSLTLLIGDDVKAAREAQMMHTIQFTLGKGDILGPSSDTDIITLGLLLNYMVTQRAHVFGAGDHNHAVALLVGTFRWSSWTPTVYYTQLLLSAFTCLWQTGSNAKLWKAFIVGRLPGLLFSFAEVVKAADHSSNVDLSGALQEGLASLFRRPDVIIEGEHAISRDATADTAPDEDSSRSFSREFLQQLIKHNLLTTQSASQLDPLVSNETPPKWHTEANDLGVDLAAYLESKLMQDNSVGDSKLWLDRIWKDSSSHGLFANIIHKRFASAVAALEVESLGQLCKILHTDENAIDIVALHKPMTDLLFYAIQFLEDYDCETVGDPQTAVSRLGDVVLFVQYALIRFKFENKDITRGNRTVSPAFFMNIDVTLNNRNLSQAEIASFNAWYKALFDNSSEGIEDNILRLTNTKVLLRIAPLLFAQAIMFTVAHNKMEKETLVNGISYFTGPLLNWTLVNVIRLLVREILQRQFAAQTIIFYDILQSLVLSPSCPKSILALCSSHIMILLNDKKRPPPAVPVPSSFNIPAIRQAIAEATGTKDGGDSLATKFPGGQIWYQQDQQAIQAAFSMARSHKAPFLDIRRCLKTLPPIKFLQLLWDELIAAASLGELESCRRIGTFVLTMPQESMVQPILPIFLFIVLPSLIANADQQQPPEQTMTTEILVAIISSVLNGAIHLEWAMRSAAKDDRYVLGQSSGTLARRLASDLRRNRTSAVSRLVLQRLASSPSFVANFPAFIGELGT